MKTSSIHKSPVWLFAALIAVAVPSVHAAPNNDHYANAANLADGPVVGATNVAATLEANEPMPPGFTSETYQGTVWWKWTPIFNGWYEISTEGSSIDTILSIWTGVGNDFSTPKYLVHSNDEASAGRISRIQFFANDQTEYRIAVAGRGVSQRGVIALRSFVITDPFAKLMDMQFVHAAVDVTNAVANITATFIIEASREIQSGALTVFTPDGVVQASVPVSGADRINGFVARGEYRVVFTLPRYIEPGGYRWNLKLEHTSLDKVASHGAGALTPLAYGITQAVQVTNNGIVDAYGVWRSQGLAQGLDAGSLTLDRFAFGMIGAGASASQPMLMAGGNLVQPGLPSIGMVTDTGGDKRLRVQFVRRLNAAQEGLTYKVQFSDDLKSWEDATEPVQWLGSNSSYEAVQVSDTVTTAAPRRFARVLVNSVIP